MAGVATTGFGSGGLASRILGRLTGWTARLGGQFRVGAIWPRTCFTRRRLLADGIRAQHRDRLEAGLMPSSQRPEQLDTARHGRSR